MAKFCCLPRWTWRIFIKASTLGHLRQVIGGQIAVFYDERRASQVSARLDLVPRINDIVFQGQMWRIREGKPTGSPVFFSWTCSWILMRMPTFPMPFLPNHKIWSVFCPAVRVILRLFSEEFYQVSFKDIPEDAFQQLRCCKTSAIFLPQISAPGISS